MRNKNTKHAGKAKRLNFIKNHVMPFSLAAALFLCFFASGCKLTVNPAQGHTARPRRETETTAIPTLPPSAITYNRIGVDSADFVDIRDFLEQKDAEGVKNGTKLAARCGEEYFPALFSDFGGCFIVNADKRLAEVYLNDIALVGKIDMTRCESLRVFECSNTNISDINLSGIKKLKSVRVENSPVSKINVSGCSAINDFVCRKTRVSEINLSSGAADLFADVTDNYCTNISLSVFSNASAARLADISVSSEGSGSVGLEFGQREVNPDINYDYIYRAYPADGYEIDAWIDGSGKECSKGTRTLGRLNNDGAADLTAVFRKTRKGAPADGTETRVLRGEILPVNGGDALPVDWSGLDIDLTGDGFKDALRLNYHGRGAYADDPLYVLSLNGERCYSWNESEPTRFFLASLDGKSIQLFIDTVLETNGNVNPQESDTPAPEESDTPTPEESDTPEPEESDTPEPEESSTPAPEESSTPAPEESSTPAPEESSTPAPEETEAHFLSVHSYDIIIDPTTQRALSDEIRLTALCPMEEFVFCENIREYLENGYNCFVCNGDNIDLDGSGTVEAVSIEYLYDLNDILSETVITAKSVSKTDSLQLAAEADGFILTYGNIEYKLGETGKLYITGEIRKTDKENGSETEYRFRVAFRNGVFGKTEYFLKSENE